jgi:hypothetical protein
MIPIIMLIDLSFELFVAFTEGFRVHAPIIAWKDKLKNGC